MERHTCRPSQRQDYAAWRKVYDEPSAASQHGCTGNRVMRFPMWQ